MNVDIRSAFADSKLQPNMLLQDLKEDLDFIDLQKLLWNPVEVMELLSLPSSWLIIKRIFDITASFIILVFLLPVFAVLAVAIKIDSRGPAIFKQIRVGKNGRRFVFYKFRTMVKDAEQQKEGLMKRNEATGPIFKIKDDPRITRIGKWLRKTSLDELPQFYNVLKGEMSLVGPRPPLQDEVNEYSAMELKRLLVLPGITGMWQINGRSDSSFEGMMGQDLLYIRNWSFWLDLKILVRTVPAVLSKRGAY